MLPSSRGLGRRPLKAVTRVRISWGVQSVELQVLYLCPCTDRAGHQRGVTEPSRAPII